ncbi:hypothetical protein [Niveibacterium sp. SC-1]|uniref:hypothetical protein n=1 Tax=Niveibacterium sp. SC-1 TaxID=3135646 RepID=UPI00311E0F69
MGEEKSQGWFQTLPGVISAVAGLIVAVGGLIAVLNQAGFFSKKATPAAPGAVVRDVDSANATIEKHPTAAIKPATPASTTTGAPPAVEGAPPATRGLSASATPEQIMQALEEANVSTSVGKAQILDWLDNDDRTYRRVAYVTLDLLDGRRLPGKAPDIDVIKYYYLTLTQRDGGGLIPLGERLDRNVMRRAIVAAFNDKNGGQIRQFDRLIAAR